MKNMLQSGLLAGALAISAFAAGPALASLPKGAEAPPVTTTGAMAGKAFRFDLAKALKEGPVVLYFFPKAFTHGCTLEARAFAEAMPDFLAAGAQVVGLSADDVETLKKFSTEECRDAFPVAQATPATIRAYDVALASKDAMGLMSDRTSYVIGQDGRIALAYSASDWREHVSRTLAAVRALDR